MALTVIDTVHIGDGDLGAVDEPLCGNTSTRTDQTLGARYVPLIRKPNTPKGIYAPFSRNEEFIVGLWSRRLPYLKDTRIKKDDRRRK